MAGVETGEARVIAIVPARLGSTRFPRKVLAAETGKTLIQHVVEAAARASSVARVVVATDADEVVEAVEAFGGEVVRTGEHPNGTSRLREAAGVLGLAADDVVVNVQGDEPEIEPETIDLAVAALVGSDCPMATVATPISDDVGNPNVVKVAVAATGRALYFSRSSIPYRAEPGGAGVLRHVGIYAYRRAFLDVYASLAATPLETAERLEQLRVLEHGHGIAVAVGESSHTGIDTPEQYAAFVGRWTESRSR